MARRYTDTGCGLYGTKYCRALNMPDCSKCPAAGGNAQSVKADIDAVDALLPPEGIHRFFDGGKCMLCRGEIKNPAVCYAMTDIGNAEPRREGRSALGIKTRLRVGSILPMQFSCCADCRRRYGRISDRRAVITVITAGAMMALLSVNSVAEALSAPGHIVPPLLFCAVVGGVWLLAGVRRKRLIKKYSKLTCLNVFDVEGMDELGKRGWFEINPYGDISRLVFSGRPLGRGLYTGAAAGEKNIPGNQEKPPETI